MIYFFIFFILALVLTWFVLAIPVWIVKYGRIVDKTIISSIFVPIRRNKIHSVINIDSIIPVYYMDRDILSDTEIVFEDDLAWGSTRLAGLSMDHFSFLHFKSLHVISINKSYSIEKDFSNETMSRLFAHEYMHRWLDKHEKDSDPLHNNKVWKELKI